MDNNFDFLQNAEIRANCSLQMQQTTSSTLNVEHMDKLNGLREFIVEKIEWSESGDPSFEMDLDREENGIRLMNYLYSNSSNKQAILI